MLKHKDMAILANKLQVPLIIRDILDGKDKLTGDVQYGLHELISNFQPDAALLSIAMSAREIAVMSASTSVNTKLLGAECERIIDEYGSLWLRNAQNKNVDVTDIIDVLVHTAEDLESLTEFLDLNAESLPNKDCTEEKLCNILHIQAKAHALIAEAFLIAADTKIEEEQNDMPALSTAMHDNIIQFPAG